MNIGQAFTFISEDEDWMKKLGLGMLIGIVPILNFAIIGYQIQISRNVAAGKERPLPDWNNLSDLFFDGLRAAGAMFVYMLPLLVLYGIAMIFVVLSIDSFDPAAMGSSGSDAPPAGFIAAMSILLLCGTPYMLFVWLLWPMISIQIARKTSFSACFDFRDMWQLVRQDWINYLLVVGLYLGLTIGMSVFIMPPMFFFLLIPCLGFIAVMVIQGIAIMLIQVVSGHLQGQFIQLSNAKPALAPGYESELL